MDQDANRKKKCSGLKKKINLFTSKEDKDAQLLDDMLNSSKISPESEPPLPPPGEFNKIVAEMERRRIKTKLGRQLKGRNRIQRVRRALQKPAVVGLLVVIILCGTSVGVSAKKSYDYRIREKEAGKTDIVLNNDQYILTDKDDVSLAYQKIEEMLSIKPLKMSTVPFDMKFSKLDINILDGSATIVFDYGKSTLSFFQAKSAISTSSNVVSDRKKYCEVFNIYLQKTFIVEKNNLPNGSIEYSTGITINGAYYNLSGILPEEDFINIIEQLYL